MKQQRRDVTPFVRKAQPTNRIPPQASRSGIGVGGGINGSHGDVARADESAKLLGN